MGFCSVLRDRRRWLVLVWANVALNTWGNNSVCSFCNVFEYILQKALNSTYFFCPHLLYGFRYNFCRGVQRKCHNSTVNSLYGFNIMQTFPSCCLDEPSFCFSWMRSSNYSKSLIHLREMY